MYISLFNPRIQTYPFTNMFAHFTFNYPSRDRTRLPRVARPYTCHTFPFKPLMSSTRHLFPNRARPYPFDWSLLNERARLAILLSPLFLHFNNSYRFLLTHPISHIFIL